MIQIMRRRLTIGAVYTNSKVFKEAPMNNESHVNLVALLHRIFCDLQEFPTYDWDESVVAIQYGARECPFSDGMDTALH